MATLTVRKNSMMSTALTGNPLHPKPSETLFSFRYTAFGLITLLARKLNLSGFW